MFCYRLEQFLSLLYWGLFTTHLASSAANKRELANRKIASEIELSEFRQVWINELRADISTLVDLASRDSESLEMPKLNAEIRKMKGLDAKIRMRLNPRGIQEKELDNCVVHLIDCYSDQKNNVKAVAAREKLVMVGSIFLKNEWDDLKKRLKKLHKDPQ